MARRLTDVTSQSISHESTPPQCLVHCLRPESSLEETSVHCLVHFYWKTFPSRAIRSGRTLVLSSFHPKTRFFPKTPRCHSGLVSVFQSDPPSIPRIHPTNPHPTPDPPRPNQSLHQFTNRHTLLSLHVTQRHRFRLYHLIMDLYIRSMI